MSGDQLLASAWGCNLTTCDFPAPDATIFTFDPLFVIELGSLSFAITKPLLVMSS